MTKLTRKYDDAFVDYCFRIGKLEADKVFWNFLLQDVLSQPCRKRRVAYAVARSYTLPDGEYV